MNKKLLILYLFIVNSLFCNHDPLLVVVLMVKNEEDVIIPTLEPFVKERIDHYLIFDTGSTDKTIEITEQYFKNNNITNGIILQEPFIDFSTSRNRALSLAKEQFPNAGFLLMIDAEWYTRNVSELIKFCKENENDNCPAYQILLKGTADNLYHLRLLRAKSNVRFEGVVHEVIVSPYDKTVPESVYFNYNPNSKGLEKTKQRWERDLALLLKKYNEDTTHSRTTFYLAQTYECLGDLHNAYKYYELRSKQPGWDEENYETFYRLARIINHLSKIDDNFNWHMAFDCYIKAHALRPHRAEPLIKIAEHYWPETPNKKDANIPLCYLFARRALDLPVPKDEKLWVEKNVYDYIRYDMVSKSAWHVKEFDIGEEATLQAIKANSPHLYNNLMCYRNSKKAKNN